ncbi:MAG TPA: beta-propeller fold lactonase family protein [Candidatus Aquilonibacter sp.]|nr:beta-propeller fold lactonase family protein [Candidatus Aquilonibacter sp.]
MRSRFAWLLGILILLAVGLLVACGRKYSSSANGLVVVPTQGSAVMDTFSLNLNNGAVTRINNTAGPPTPGAPTNIVIDPAGQFVYVIVTQTSALPGSLTGIATYKVGSDGKLSSAGTTAMSNPVALAMDSDGKFLFVANGTDGTVTVLSVSSGTLNEVGVTGIQSGPQGPANVTALAASPTVFPSIYAACSGKAAPTSENLYVTDSQNYLVWEFGVSSSGALGNPPGDQSPLSFATGTLPSGVAVDPCNRFLYVANQSPDNSISSYTICNTLLLPVCPVADGSLVEVQGSPFPTQGIDPGPMLEDPYGKHLYVVNTRSSSITAYKIGQATGALTAMTPSPIATNSQPKSIAIRSDGLWLFVANFNSANVSQYAVTPASGQLVPQAAFGTDNYPFGVAVK